MKTLIIILSLSLYMVGSAGQQVVATAGNSWSVPGYTVEWTLGEIAIETYNATGIILTQGMHQPGLSINNVYDSPLYSMEIKVFPNPVNDILILELIKSGNMQFRYELSDITGRIIQIRQIQSSREEINLDNYNSGIYLLRIMTTDNQPVKLYKIIKR